MSSHDRPVTKPTVLISVNAPGDLLCVDVFLRDDGSYGFEEFRRDPEDGRGWFPVGGFSSQRFETEDAATRAAESAVVWFQTSPNRKANKA